MWQSMETAPKDGKRIIVYRKCGKSSFDKDSIYIALWGEYGWEGDCIAVGYENNSVYVGEPTHWMSLPEHPTESSEIKI